MKKLDKDDIALCICLGILVLCCAGLLGYGIKEKYFPSYEERPQEVSQQTADMDSAVTGATTDASKETAREAAELEILPEYTQKHEQNKDMVGWLRIADTVIDYPVMQTPWNEDYYLRKGFDEEYDIKGSLIMDTDSVVGIGTAAADYAGGKKPGTNLIIHGHTMKTGTMFGGLEKYKDKAYGEAHKTIEFDTLYEKREYELISVFYSEIFYEDQDVFKYYKFFQADTEEEFDDWYENITKNSLYDTGVTAEFGDEFITLSCCSYHTQDGRFVVIGKRVK